jgi:hypothetical protein
LHKANRQKHFINPPTVLDNGKIVAMSVSYLERRLAAQYAFILFDTAAF